MSELGWAKKIPTIQFPADWRVGIIPPFGGAMIRFKVATNTDRYISVYLDCYDNLGCVGEPYWEIYPYKEDCKRFLMNEVDELIQGIKEAKEQIEAKEGL